MPMFAYSIGDHVTQSGCMPYSYLSRCASAPESLPPLDGTRTSHRPSWRLNRSSMRSNCPLRSAQSIWVRLISAYWHALQTPSALKVMRGRWFEITHRVQKNTSVGRSGNCPSKERRACSPYGIFRWVIRGRWYLYSRYSRCATSSRFRAGSVAAAAACLPSNELIDISRGLPPRGALRRSKHEPPIDLDANRPASLRMELTAVHKSVPDDGTERLRAMLAQRQDASGIVGHGHVGMHEIHGARWREMLQNR